MNAMQTAPTLDKRSGEASIRDYSNSNDRLTLMGSFGAHYVLVQEIGLWIKVEGFVTREAFTEP